MKISALGEFNLINRIKSISPTSSRVIETIGDDTAVLSYTKDKDQLFTTDMMTENVHFTRRMSARLIGHKALACNISDIAAMGGIPTFAVVSLGVPKTLPIKWVDEMYQGIATLAKQFDVSIVGGDTIKSDKITINIALLGEVEKKYCVLRRGAKPGDAIFVTGLLGGSLKSGRHLDFIPKVEQARFLVKKFKPSAMMDISDGLAGDLNHILSASGVGAHLNDTDIPCHQGVSLKQALTDGEDYELLFTLSSTKAKALMNWQIKNKCWFYYPIGEIVKDRKHIIKSVGYRHF